jgi:outer membrane immunogenic protein
MRASLYKTLALAGVLGVSLSVPALADGVGYRDRPGCCGYNWSGFYVGVHGGYGWGESDWVDLLGTLGANVKFGDLRGAIGGGQVGFNWQTGPWVLGVEGTLSGGSIDQTGTVGIARLTTDVEWMGTVVGRLGYAWDRSLIYVKGGYATANIELRGDNGVDTFKGSERHNGWTIGTGVEFAILKNLSLGLEYNYYDFGRETYAITTTNGLPLSIDADAQVHSFLARLNLRFGDDRRHGPLK